MPAPAPDPPLVAGQEDGVLPGGDSTSTGTVDSTSPHCTGQNLPPKTTSFQRNFANRVWTSPSYKKARQQERFDPPQVLLLDTSGPLGARCKALADPEAIPYLEPGTAPQEQEARLMLQCLWSRSIIAIIASLPTIAPQEELALGLLQAIKASAAIAILTVPRDHSLLRSPEISACLHDSAFHMCPSPCQGEVILASSKLPTWPCPDSELVVLEDLGASANYRSDWDTSRRSPTPPFSRPRAPSLPTALRFATAPEHPARQITAYRTPQASAKPQRLG